MKKAFTLIQLLVVIAIIAILAAILFPVFAQAKQAAKKSSDLSNIKQLSLGMHTYTADYDDILPSAYFHRAWDPASGGTVETRPSGNAGTALGPDAAAVDVDRAPVLAASRAEGATSFRAMAAALNARGIPTPRGGRWHPGSVVQVLRLA